MSKAKLQSRQEWKETRGAMAIGHAFDAAKSARYDFFAHDAKRVTKDEFVQAMVELQIQTLGELLRAIEEDAGTSFPGNWPIETLLLFEELPQAINDAICAVAEWAANLFAKEVVGANPVDL
jgi:hypothetical protein